MYLARAPSAAPCTSHQVNVAIRRHAEPGYQSKSKPPPTTNRHTQAAATVFTPHPSVITLHYLNFKTKTVMDCGVRLGIMVCGGLRCQCGVHHDTHVCSTVW